MTESTPDSKTLAQLLVQNSVDGLAAIDRDFRYTLWNRAMEEFAGKRADEVLGRVAFEVFPFLQELGLDLAIKRALAGEAVTAEAVPNELPDGSRRYYDRLYLPLRGDDGAILGMLAIVRDVTARRRAEDALRANQEQLHLAVDAAGIGLWSWNTRTDEVHWEEPLLAIFGLPAGATPSGREAYASLIHPEDRARSMERIARGVEVGHWEDEYRILRSDGEVRWVMAKASMVREVAFGAVMDVTDRRQRDEQLRQSQKLEAVGQLTAGVAHNFNNMLMGMLPNLETAVRGAPAELLPLLRDAERSAQRAADLVRQLMTYSGRNSPAVRTVEPIAALVERAVAFCRKTFDQRIAFDARYDRAACARVNPIQLEQVVLNCLINARDAIAQTYPSCVTLRVEIVWAGAPELEGRAGDHVCIRIGDNGMGMDAATVGRIFEPFFTTKPVGKGTGLGLATARAIVLEHEGFLKCDSALGKGTTFSIYLKRDQTVAADARLAADPAAVAGKETILVVDDEPLIRRVVSRILTGAGFVAKLAGSGDDALALLADPAAAAEIALILLDVSMPGTSGRELRNRIRELAPHTRVVYFSGYAFEAPDAGDAVLNKPATSEEILATIRKLLDGPRASGTAPPTSVEP